MDLRRFTRLLLWAAPIAICGCISATKAGPSQATVTAQSQSENLQKPVAKSAIPCESPEVTSGDVHTVGTAPCGGTQFENEERFENEQHAVEPVESHPTRE